MIPMRENQWWIAEPKGGGTPMWFCPACGKQYKHGIDHAKDLTHGQDLVFNYIVFLQFRLHDGMHTLCAMAQAPCTWLQNQIITLKLMLASYPRAMNKGAVAGILDMMTCSSDMFVAAMESFPKTSRKIVHPYHVGLGEYMEIKCDGIASLSSSAVGSHMDFLDMNQAYRNGMFWRQPEDLGRR